MPEKYDIARAVLDCGDRLPVVGIKGHQRDGRCRAAIGRALWSANRHRFMALSSRAGLTNPNITAFHRVCRRGRVGPRDTPGAYHVLAAPRTVAGNGAPPFRSTSIEYGRWGAGLAHVAGAPPARVIRRGRKSAAETTQLVLTCSGSRRGLCGRGSARVGALSEI